MSTARRSQESLCAGEVEYACRGLQGHTVRLCIVEEQREPRNKNRGYRVPNSTRKRGISLAIMLYQQEERGE